MDKTKIRRTFSESFKRCKVKEIETGICTISEISKQYGVTSVNVYRWLKKYSSSYTPPVRMVIELESESRKTAALVERLSELERIIGVKQLEIDWLNTLVTVSSEELGTDLRKVFFIKHSIVSET